jgi:regulator of cell morphogenesis and NO signaling
MTDSTKPTPQLDPAAITVNELLQLHPSSVAVFNDFGIDACCGGARTIREAASEDGVDAAALVAALEATLHDDEADA